MEDMNKITMRYRILYWRYKRKLKKQTKLVFGLLRERRENRKGITALRKKAASLEDGYVVEWCDSCKNQIVMLWNPEKDGLMAYCPVCGNVMMLCDSCHWRCDYNFGNDYCIGKRFSGK